VTRKNFAGFSSKTGTSWSKIALTNIYCSVSHPPRCTQKACYEPAERKIAASAIGPPRQPAARSSGCRNRMFRICGFCYVRLPVPVCCPDGWSLSAGNDAVEFRGLFVKRSWRASPSAGSLLPASPLPHTSPAALTACARRCGRPGSPHAWTHARRTPSPVARHWRSSS
jgi:hypothetical protein